MSYLEHKTKSSLLYKTQFDNDNYVIWEPLEWGKYLKLQEALMVAGSVIEMDIEEMVFRDCVLYSTFDIPAPEEVSNDPGLLEQWTRESRDDLPAGVVPTVARDILRESGTVDKENLKAHVAGAHSILTYLDRAVMMICQAFPAYKPEDVEAMRWAVIAKRVAQAELLLGEPFIPEEKNEARDQAQMMNQIINRANASGGSYDPDAGQQVREERAAFAAERQRRQDARSAQNVRGM